MSESDLEKVLHEVGRADDEDHQRCSDSEVPIFTEQHPYPIEEGYKKS